ncbi:hypothetical protein [Spiroplasma endosymbiont of Stenodema calcarata]|uniref:hypothetical protein n=1 Tax=Spiroplasma endosymbiont of Stenodema calcarata TaxID=3139328 RepID=UPI003CCA751C
MKFLLVSLAAITIGSTVGNIIYENKNYNNIQESNQWIIKNDIDYEWEGYYGSITTATSDSSMRRVAFNWKKYASSWDEFAIKYPYFAADLVISAGLSGVVASSSGNIHLAWTKKLDDNRSYSVQFGVNAFDSSIIYASLIVKLWTIDDNIHWAWNAYFKGRVNIGIYIKFKAIAFYKFYNYE